MLLSVKIAVMSDSHDNCDALAQALDMAARKGATHVIHLGDIISPFTSRVFRSHYGGDVSLLFGNNDGDRIGLIEAFSKVDARFYHPPATLRIGGLTIAAMHEPLFPESLAATGSFDAVLWGHTHELQITQQDGVLMLNPGELHGFVSGKKTFVLLDTGDMSTQVIEL